MLSVSGEYGIVNQIEFQGRSFAGESVAEYHVVETNDIVYTKSPLKANPYGIIKVNNGAPGIVSTLYAVYHPCEGTVAEYIDYYFGNDLRLNKYLKPLVNIGAKHDMKVNNETVLTGEVYFPGYSEQKKIVGFLTILDERIRQQRNLVEALKKYKRGLLHEVLCEKIKITKSPWNVCKIGDYLSSKNIKQLPTPEAPLMAFTATGGVCDKGERYDRGFLVKDASTKLYKRTDLNDFIYSSNNLDVGSIGLNLYGSAVISDVYEIFSISGADPWFISEAIRQKPVLHQILKYRQGCLYGQYRIYAEDFLEVSIRVPSLETQKQIGIIFSRIDYRIKSEQALLKSLENAQKFFLQQLFI